MVVDQPRDVGPELETSTMDVDDDQTDIDNGLILDPPSATAQLDPCDNTPDTGRH